MVCQERRIAFGSPSFLVTMYYIKQLSRCSKLIAYMDLVFVFRNL